jgi:hypothetical protein
MNPRERRMAILLGAFIVLGGGGFFLYQFLYVPWQQQEARKKNLEDEIFKKKLDLIALTKELPKLATWRLESLPSDPVLAKREYYIYLLDLLNRARWTIKSFSPGLVEVKQGPLMPDKKAIYTSLIYAVEAQATEAQIVDFLQQFAKTPLMHKVKSLVVDQPPPRVAGGKQQGPPANGADLKGKGFAAFGKDKGFAGFGKDKGAGAFGKGNKGKGAGDFAGFGKGNKGKGAGGLGKGGFGGRGERMTVRLQVEALIVGGPDKHWTSLSGLDDRLVVLDVIAGHFGGPVGLAQVPWLVSPQGVRPPPVLAQTAVPRNYSDIARALLFSGQPETTTSKRGFLDYGDVRQFVKLNMISWDSKLKRGEANLYNQLTNQDIRLRDDDSGFKQFVIRDDDFEVKVRGAVLKISNRDVYFSVDGEIYAIHIGDSVADAMWETVPAEEAKQLGLIPPK